MVQSIEMNLSLQSYGEHEWRPPVLKTVATMDRAWMTYVAADRAVSRERDG